LPTVCLLVAAGFFRKGRGPHHTSPHSPAFRFAPLRCPKPHSAPTPAASAKYPAIWASLAGGPSAIGVARSEVRLYGVLRSSPCRFEISLIWGIRRVADTCYGGCVVQLGGADGPRPFWKVVRGLMPTTTKSYFTRPLALLFLAALATSVIIGVLWATPAHAATAYTVDRSDDPDSPLPRPPTTARRQPTTARCVGR
jgi:hypothetical protein